MAKTAVKQQQAKSKTAPNGMTPKEKRNNFLLCLLAILVAIIFLFPIYWLISMSFKTDAESFGKVVTYYPHNFTVEPWVKNFTDADFLSSLKNSFVIAILSMILSMGFGVCSAYGMIPATIGETFLYNKKRVVIHVL